MASRAERDQRSAHKKSRRKDPSEQDARNAEERRNQADQDDQRAENRSEEPEYLANLCERISKHIKDIPDEVVSSNSDCLHYARTCDLVTKVYRICGACVRHKVFGQDWDAAKSAMGAQGAFPLTESIAKARKLLIGAVMNHGDRISYNYRISGKDNRLVDNIMSIIFTLDMLQFVMLPGPDQKTHRKFVAEEDEWLVVHNVAVASDASISDYKSPVLSYRMSQFIASIYQLASSWTNLVYSPRLVYYLELIRIRMGYFINFTYSGKVHDVQALRHCERDPSRECPDGEYQSDSRLIQVVSPVITDIFKRVVRFASHRQATPEQMSALKGKRNAKVMIKHFGRWIDDKIKVMLPEGASEKMAQYLLPMSLRPGERAVYAREFPSGTNLTDEQFILGRYRKIEFNYLSELKTKTFAQVIQKELPKLLTKKPSECGRESPQLLLCLYELIEMYTKAAYFGRMDLSDFVIFEVDYDKRETDFLYVQEPIMVQVFNHFQLFYHGVLYRFDSFIMSFIAWLKIMERDFRRKLRTCDISGWYMELLDTQDPSVRIWEPASLFGSDEEEESTPANSDDEEDEEASEDGKKEDAAYDESEKPKAPRESSAPKQTKKSSGQDSVDRFAVKSAM